MQMLVGIITVIRDDCVRHDRVRRDLPNGIELKKKKTNIYL